MLAAVGDPHRILPLPFTLGIASPLKNKNHTNLMETNLKMSALCLSQRKTLSGIPSGSSALAVSQGYIPGEQAPFIQPCCGLLQPSVATVDELNPGSLTCLQKRPHSAYKVLPLG